MTNRQRRLIIAIGSNTDAEKNIDRAEKLLGEAFGRLHLTRRLWTDPIGEKTGNQYLDCLAYGYTQLEVDEVVAAIKSIEKTIGRAPEDKSQGIIKIDLDLLLHGRTKHHIRDWEFPYIKELSKEIKWTSKETP